MINLTYSCLDSQCYSEFVCAHRRGKKPEDIERISMKPRPGIFSVRCYQRISISRRYSDQSLEVYRKVFPLILLPFSGL